MRGSRIRASDGATCGTEWRCSLKHKSYGLARLSLLVSVMKDWGPASPRLISQFEVVSFLGPICGCWGFWKEPLSWLDTKVAIVSHEKSIRCCCSIMRT